MADGMTISQLRGWLAYYECEPWGEERADLRAGIVAATVGNVHRGKGRVLSPSDFMPRFGEPRKQTQAEAHAIFAAFAAAHNARQASGDGR